MIMELSAESLNILRTWTKFDDWMSFQEYKGSYDQNHDGNRTYNKVCLNWVGFSFQYAVLFSITQGSVGVLPNLSYCENWQFS